LSDCRFYNTVLVLCVLGVYTIRCPLNYHQLDDPNLKRNRKVQLSFFCSSSSKEYILVFQQFTVD